MTLPEAKIPNSNIQIPNKSQIPIYKLQIFCLILNNLFVWDLEFWSLEFIWNLEFGIWNFLSKSLPLQYLSKLKGYEDLLKKLLTKIILCYKMQILYLLH